MGCRGIIGGRPAQAKNEQKASPTNMKTTLASATLGAALLIAGSPVVRCV